MLKENMSFSPFMGDTKPLSIGLNPLGIRTASEQLFTTLLPGLNVVTLRVRYYSFYCWLLKSFYEERTEAKRSDLQRHIRMSELLMALIHAQSNNSGGVPGIIRAMEIIQRGEERIDFNEDAMPKGKPVGGYWKGSFGAFGTYYVAQLQQIGIILPLVDSKNLYNITPYTTDYISGAELADSFAESIGKEAGRLFLMCATKGVVTRQHLASLEKVFQTHNMPDNKERTLLLRMLVQDDRPAIRKKSKMRKNSLRLLLCFLEDRHDDGFSELDFAKYVYERYNKGIERSMTSAGWYAYYLNDSRQYESLIIFDVVLERLLDSTMPGQWENIDEFTKKLANEVGDTLHAGSMTIKEVLDKWDSIKEPDDKMAHAFYTIIDDYRKNIHYEDCKSTIKTYYHNVSNDALDAFDRVTKSLEVPLIDFVKHYLTEEIIYNHYSESMRKYSQNGILSQKLTIENGFVRGLSRYSPSHSSPRIDTLRIYATDLGLIDNNKLTQNGKNYLKMLQNDRA